MSVGDDVALAVEDDAGAEAAFAPLTDNLVLPVQGLGRKRRKK
mgnify:CR=1 FL=1